MRKTKKQWACFWMISHACALSCHAFSAPINPNSHNHKDEIRIDPPEFYKNGIEWVVQQAFMAVDGVLNDCCAPMPMDRHVCADSMMSLPSLQPQNRGRIGIEVDGARYLLTYEMKSRCFERIYTKYLQLNKVTRGLENEEEVHTMDTGAVLDMAQKMSPNDDRFLEDFALRIFSFMLASKLSRQMPLPTSGEESELTSTSMPSSPIPIVLYFRDIHEALQANTDLQTMKESAKDVSMYDNISICHLGDNTLPDNIGYKDLDSKDDRRKRRSSGHVDAKNGIAIIIQPFNRDMENLQRISMIYALNSIPLVLLSPRLGNNIETECAELANSYGGEEPARHPWFLKDFLPPAFAWIVDATAQRDMSVPRIALLRSVQDKDHAWHLFQSKRTPVPIEEYNRKTSKLCNIEHIYFASIPSSTGRPSSELIIALWRDWRNKVQRRQLIGE